MTYNNYTLGVRNNYLYNGKELQDGLGHYDFGARFYDQVIGQLSMHPARNPKAIAVAPSQADSPEKNCNPLRRH